MQALRALSFVLVISVACLGCCNKRKPYSDGLYKNPLNTKIVSSLFWRGGSKDFKLVTGESLFFRVESIPSDLTSLDLDDYLSTGSTIRKNEKSELLFVYSPRMKREIVLTFYLTDGCGNRHME